MAIRYSGDVEIRLTFVDGKFRAAVRASGFHAKGTLTPREAGLTRKHQPSSSESYDQAALVFFREAKALAKKKGLSLPLSEESGHIEVRRTFQAPCPVRAARRHS
jgi:hypothetical protein